MIMTSGFHKLWIPTRGQASCPKLEALINPGIVRYKDNVYWITIPSLGLQYTVSLVSQIPLCYHSRTPIYRTSSGELISLPILPRMDPKLRNRVSDQNLKYFQKDQTLIDFSAQFLYDLNHLESLVEKELWEIEHDICLLLHREWINLGATPDPNEVAFYITRDPWARGELQGSNYLVNKTHASGFSCYLPPSRMVRFGQVLLICDKKEVWVQAWSGLIMTESQNVSQPIRPPWLPMTNGHYINYLTGQIQISIGRSLVELPRIHGINITPILSQEPYYYEVNHIETGKVYDLPPQSLLKLKQELFSFPTFLSHLMTGLLWILVVIGCLWLFIKMKSR